MSDIERLPSRLIDGFRRLSTANVSDALDRLKIRGGCEGITPIIEGTRTVGSAFTVRYVPVGTVAKDVGDYVDLARPGDVIVIDNSGRMYCTVWGDLLTLVAVKKGIAGTVIDGVCRDIHRIKELRYPIFTRGRFIVTGKDRVQMDAANKPVSISNVQVKPGDLVVGDESGVVIVPQERAEEIFTIATEISEKERQIENEVESGSELREARRKHGYHMLQRPRD